MIALSGIGSDTLLLHPHTFTRSQPTPDRLHFIREYVKKGGGFIMIGGYLSFQGYGGAAHYRFTPEVVADHKITRGLPKVWPILLGYNKVKPTGAVLVKAGKGDPLIIIGEHGAGRTAAFTSDCSPHWAPPEFVSWDHYGTLWFRLMSWLARG